MKKIFTIFLMFFFFYSTNLLFAQGSQEQNINEETLGSHVLMANPGPANNGGSSGWAIFLDLIAASSPIQITGMTTASSAASGADFTIEFFTRQGTALGGVTSSSTVGWTSLGTVTVTQGAVASGISLPFSTPSISIAPSDTVGVAMVFTGTGPRYFGTGSPPLGVYSDAFLTLVTGEVKTVPFTTGGSFFSSRELVGEIQYDDVVPVELTSFNYLINENNVVLSWTTATETNNQGFEIQRLKDSKIEELSVWENIGFVPGFGTSTEVHNYSFTDGSLQQGKYQYRLKQIDFNGSYEYSNIVEAEIITPLVFSLEQNYPNPFNPVSNIQYAVGKPSFVTLKVYDVLGNEVAALVNDYKEAGVYDVQFTVDNLSDDRQSLSSGIYFYTIKAENFTQTRKMILMK